MKTSSAPSGFNILLVDDDEVTLQYCTFLLQRQGYTIETAGSGDEALELLDHPGHGIDLVLLDLAMPGKNGHDTLREIRRSFSKEALPVFVVTAKERKEDILSAFEAGADDFLVKPLDAGISLPKIEARLRLRAPRRMDSDPQVGDTVGDKYLLEQRIGSGGFGTVYRARHLELDAVVAIKLLQDRAFVDQSARTRLRTEGRVLAKLNHPNTVRVWDLVTVEAVPFLVMDFLDGHDLSQELPRRSPMSPAIVCSYGAQIAAGLAAAHQLSILHRDIKPQNIFLCQRSQGSQLKLLDFGLAAMADEMRQQFGGTPDGQLLGSPRYLAPERVLGSGYLKPSDIYSLGIVLYEMLSGKFPYPMASMSIAELVRAHTQGHPGRFEEIGLEVPPALEDLIFSTLAKDPGQRPDCEELLTRLSQIGQRLRNQSSSHEDSDSSETPDTEPIDLVELQAARFDDMQEED